MKKICLEKKNCRKKAILIWVLLLLGFCAIEFPVILFVKNRVYPFILGMPFLYGYAICCWAYLVCVFFFAWRTRWGRQAFFKKNR